MDRDRLAAARAKMHEAVDDMFAAMSGEPTEAPPVDANADVTEVDKQRARKRLQRMGYDV